MYSVTSNGEVYEDSLLAGVPGWRLATLYYSARTGKRHDGGTPIFDRANYDKLAATTYASVADLEGAIRKADEIYAKRGSVPAAKLDTAAKAFVGEQFVPSDAFVPSDVSLTTTSAMPEKKKKRRRRRRKQMPEWVVPVAVGGGVLILVGLLFARRQK